MGRKKRKKRGFPVGVLVNFAEQQIQIWKIFSESIKKYKNYSLIRKWKNSSEKDVYHYYEALIDYLRPLMDKGLKSIVLVTPKDKNWSDGFLNHVEKHHRWLINSKGTNQAFFAQIYKNINSTYGIRLLLENENVKDKIKDLASQEAYFIIKQLEKSINKNNGNIKISYGLDAIEKLIFKGGKRDNSVADSIDFLLLTDEFLEEHPQKNRIYRLKQIAQNKGITTKVISQESFAGERINQFGGIICFKTIGNY